MKKKGYALFLALWAALCAALALCTKMNADFLLRVFSFPFAQIGALLRALSLSGTAGNAAAIALYAAVSLLPSAFFLFLLLKKRLRPEDFLLPLLSVLFFAAIYFMINPGLLDGFFRLFPAAASKSVLGGAIYSVLLGNLILRGCGRLASGGTERLFGAIGVLLGVLGALFVFAAFGAGLSGLLSDISKLAAANQGSEGLLPLTNFFLVLGYLNSALPHLFGVFIVLCAMRLTREMRLELYSASAFAAAAGLSQLCTGALYAIVLSNICFNLLQLLLAKRLLSVNSLVNVPVFPIIFVLAALLLARLIEKGRLLKDDNDMFI